MSIFDDENEAVVNKAFTKENVIQSIKDGYKNGWTPQICYEEYDPDDKLENYVLLAWQLDNPSYLGNPDNTAGFQLEYITAMFGCNIDSTGEAIIIEVGEFKELEVEHEESTSGLDGLFYVRDNKHLVVEAKDFKEAFENAVAAWNEQALAANEIDELQEKQKVIKLSIK